VVSLAPRGDRPLPAGADPGLVTVPGSAVRNATSSGASFTRSRVDAGLIKLEHKLEKLMALAGYIIAGIFALGIVVAIAVHFGWSISTQHRDHEVAASGAVPRRWIWSRRAPRAHAGPVNPEALPLDPVTGRRPVETPATTPAEDH
jgi:hypothetical protein